VCTSLEEAARRNSRDSVRALLPELQAAVPATREALTAGATPSTQGGGSSPPRRLRRRQNAESPVYGAGRGHARLRMNLRARIDRAAVPAPGRSGEAPPGARPRNVPHPAARRSHRRSEPGWDRRRMGQWFPSSTWRGGHGGVRFVVEGVARRSS
jgi:hypothetical protein